MTTIAFLVEGDYPITHNTTGRGPSVFYIHIQLLAESGYGIDGHKQGADSSLHMSKIVDSYMVSY